MISRGAKTHVDVVVAEVEGDGAYGRGEGTPLYYLGEDAVACRDQILRAAPHIAEMGAADEVYSNPKHPYTAALLSAVPKGESEGGRSHRIVLTGDVPSPVNPPPGCAFHPRCPKARLVTGRADVVPESCSSQVPELDSAGAGHNAACWYPLERADELQRARTE